MPEANDDAPVPPLATVSALENAAVPPTTRLPAESIVVEAVPPKDAVLAVLRPVNSLVDEALARVVLPAIASVPVAVMFVAVSDPPK